MAAPSTSPASCLILTPNLSHVLLCSYRKGQFWVRLGGYIEAADTSVAEAAIREARAESGIPDLVAC